MIKMPRRVYKEITENRSSQDELAQWLVRRDVLGTPSTKEIQEFANKIGAHVFGGASRYRLEHALRFSNGADPWLVAHAAVDGGAVVTREKPEPASKKPKVPDICVEFKVKWVHFPKFIYCLENNVSPDRCNEPFSD
jgi:hypothetical protein